ncbi:rab GTPase-binding effector protein 1 isoform X2 [Bacillus rossius redtenbacheri]|uniref:rab GTPase-binding effector protein 1 isoform X2 n=1 Tax=Bacillus rossius redtenbacheri TaxID=93214 RepID=UPI002FDECF7B
MENSHEMQATLSNNAVDKGPSLTSEGELLKRIKELEDEKQKSHEEFGHQRAKMKELYLQKDVELRHVLEEKEQLQTRVKSLSLELDEAKSQLVVERYRSEQDAGEERRRFRQETASLQQLIRETIEESSRHASELEQLRAANRRLEAEVQEMRAHTSTDRDSPLLAPAATLSAMTKTLARKVASQLGADPSAPSQDSLEDSMRKAQEDAEVLRSLVVPLEEEIQALKDKLRHTDQQLRKFEDSQDHRVKCGENEVQVCIDNDLDQVESHSFTNVDSPAKVKSGDGENQEDSCPDVEEHLSQDVTASPSPVASLPPAVIAVTENDDKSIEDASTVLEVKDVSADEDKTEATCDMCLNYETQLVKAQQHTKELEKQLAAMERTCERFREDLVTESTFRKEMEEKWNEKREEHKARVAELKQQVADAESVLTDLRQVFKQVQVDIKEKLLSLTQQREQVQEQLTRLQKENDNLIGKHSMNSEELQDQEINFPNTVEELHEMLLAYRDELIKAKVAKEVKEEQERTLQCEVQLLRAQMNAEQEGRVSMEDSLTAELDSLKTHLHQLERENHTQQDSLEKLELTVTRHQETIANLKFQLEEALRAKKQLEDTVADLRSRVGSLQQELDNSEAVQKDFVRLSQSLQVQLERIRDTDTEVRWQHDDDIEDCQNCRTPFTVSRRKQHCRHCGRIFCGNCLSHSVQSGPNQRPSRVCDVCHTLLVRNTAPYFSTEPPHTPD